MSQLAYVSDTFDEQRWFPVPGFEKLTDLTFHRAVVKAGSADTSVSSSSSEAQEQQKPYKPGRNRYELTDFAATELADRGEIGDKLTVLRISFDRPQVRNAFRPHTVDELLACLEYARSAADVAAIILTGNGPSSSDGGYSFCSGGDQRIRDRGGYRYEQEGADPDAEVSQRRQNLDLARTGRLHILEVQRLIR